MGRQVIFTREHALDEVWQERLKATGFEAVHLPLIRCAQLPLPAAVSQELPRADWVLFTSAVAVDFFSPCLPADSIKIGTIGLQTSAAVRAQGYAVDFEARSHYAVDFAAEWLALGLPQQTILLPQSSLSNPVIADSLAARGHRTVAWPLYETAADSGGQAGIADLLAEESLIWTFASPSAWQSFQAVKPNLPESHRIAVIGKTTAQAVEQAGCRVDFLPETPAVGQMIEEIIEKEGKQS